MVNPKSLENLQRAGRKRAFTTEQAQQILHARRFGFPQRMTVERFGQILLEEGIISEPVAEITLRRLLNGTLYPDLIDPEAPGYAYPYSTLPELVRGRPSQRARAIDPLTGKPRRPISKAKEDFKRSIREEIQADIQSSFLYVSNRVRELLSVDIDYLKQQWVQANKEISSLKTQLASLQPSQ